MKISRSLSKEFYRGKSGCKDNSVLFYKTKCRPTSELTTEKSALASSHIGPTAAAVSQSKTKVPPAGERVAVHLLSPNKLSQLLPVALTAFDNRGVHG